MNHNWNLITVTSSNLLQMNRKNNNPNIYKIIAMRMEHDNKQCMTFSKTSFTFQNKCFRFETTKSFEMTVNVVCIVIVYVCNHTHFKRINKTMFDERIFWCVVFGRLFFFISSSFSFCYFKNRTNVMLSSFYIRTHKNLSIQRLKTLRFLSKCLLSQMKICNRILKSDLIFIHIPSRSNCDLFNDSIHCYLDADDRISIHHFCSCFFFSSETINKTCYIKLCWGQWNHD